ncbi:dTMP kinase [Aerococcaceae bacterium DSM 111176]|nr:dTMP kinase [Aerococcaceae bacterium DSM 111176]
MPKGKFISFEGPDGSGKTSVIKAIAAYMEEQGQSIYTTREPGGTGSVIAEEIRELILDVRHTNMDARTEALLYAAGRRQHLTEVILPKLERGHLVLSDRFVDSSLVYQGIARGLTVERVKEINDFAIEGHLPDMTILIDVPAEVGLERIYAAKGTRQFDRLDQEGLEFHQSVREAFLELAANDERIHLINGNQPIENVVSDCLELLKTNNLI